MLTKEENLNELQLVHEQAPTYSLNISGELPSSNAAAEVFSAIPENFNYDKKFVIGVWLENELIGIMDLLRGYPNNETAMLGLLLLKEKYQGKGLGKKSFEELLIFINSWAEINKMRISVIENNRQVLEFWHSLGFIETGVRRPYENGKVISEAIVLEKLLSLVSPVKDREM